MTNRFEQFRQTSQTEPKANRFAKFKTAKSDEGQKYEDGVPVGGNSNVRPELYKGKAKEALPEPSMAMYDNDRTAEDAQRRYDQYAAQDEEGIIPQSMAGGTTVNGKIVPKPVPHILGQIGNAVAGLFGARPFADYKASPADVAVGTASTMAANALEFGGSIMDTVTGRNDAQGVKEAIPTLEGGNVANDLVIEGGALVLGGGGALKATEMGVKLTGAVTRLGRAAQLIGRNTAMSIGGAAVTDADSGGIVTGDNALIPLFEGVPVADDGTYSGEVLNKRLGLIVEGVLAGAAIDVGAGVAGGLLNTLNENIINPAKAQLSGDARVRRVFDTLMKKGFGAENIPPEQYQQRVLEIAEYVSQEKQVLLEAFGGKNTTVNLDTFGAVAQGMDKAGDEVGAATVRQRRADLVDRGIDGMDEQQATFDRDINQYRDDLHTTAGGERSVETARKGLVDEANTQATQAELPMYDAAGEVGRRKADQFVADRDVTMADDAVRSADDNLRTAQLDVSNARLGKISADDAVETARRGLDEVRNARKAAQDEVELLAAQDPTFASKVKVMAQEAGLDNAGRSYDTGSEAIETLRQVRLADKKEQADAYGALSPDLDIGNNAFDDAYSTVREILPDNLRAKYEGPDYDETTQTRLDLSYKDLYDTLPMINDEISARSAILAGNGISDPAARNAMREELNLLRGFKNHIQEEQLIDAAMSGGPEIVAQVGRIRAANEKLYRRWDNEGFRDLGELIDGATLKETGGVNPRYEMDYDVGSRQALDTNLRDSNKAYADELYRMFEDGGNRSQATQYIKDKISRDLQTGVQTPEEALASFQPFLVTLRDNDPKAYEELVKFQREIESFNTDKATLNANVQGARQKVLEMKPTLRTKEDELSTARTASRDASRVIIDKELAADTQRLAADSARRGRDDVKRIADGERENVRQAEQAFGVEAAIAKESTDKTTGRVKDFYEGSGGARREIDSGQRAFERIFDSAGGEQTLRDLQSLADDSAAAKNIRRGMKAAFGKAIKTDPDYVKNNVDRIKEQAAVIYKDDPAVLESVNTALDLIRNNDVRGGNGAIAAIPTELDEQGRDAVSRLITTGFGVLNSLATRVRLLSRSVQDTVDPKEHMIKVLGELVTNPDEFIRVAKNRATEIGNQMSGPDKGVLFNLFVRAGIYTDKVEDRKAFEQDLMDSQTSSEDRQTEEMFR